MLSEVLSFNFVDNYEESNTNMKKVIDESSSDATNDTSVSKQTFILKQVIVHDDVNDSNDEACNTMLAAKSMISAPNPKRYVFFFCLFNFSMLLLLLGLEMNQQCQDLK